jgi:hypothetical protein
MRSSRFAISNAVALFFTAQMATAQSLGSHQPAIGEIRASCASLVFNLRLNR